MAAAADRPCVRTEEELETRTGPTLFVQTWQPPEGVDVIARVMFTHGHGEHSNRYEHVFPVYASHGIYVTAWDVVGHGRSSGEQGDMGSFDSLMDIMMELFARDESKFRGTPRFLYGHSMGGCLTLNFAYRRLRDYALAGVICSGPQIELAMKPPTVKVFFGKLFSSVSPSTVIETELDAAGISRDPAEVARYVADPLNHGKISLKAAADALSWSKGLLSEGADYWCHPLAIFHGTADPITSAAGSERFVHLCCNDDKTYVPLEGLYHEIHNEPEKDEVIAQMVDWVLAHVAIFNGEADASGAAADGGGGGGGGSSAGAGRADSGMFLDDGDVLVGGGIN